MATKLTRVKTKAAAVPIPQSREEAIEAVAEMGRRQRERERIQATMNDEIAGIKTAYEEEARPHNEAIQALKEGIHTWCEANRAQLTNGGKVKSANLASGDVGWRTTPPRVKVTGLQAVIELIKSLKLLQFLRVKEEINKEAMLADPESAQRIKGVEIVQIEEFWVVPFETKLEEIAS
jgi:phage host-nuclease inhibitor protein Gam